MLLLLKGAIPNPESFLSGQVAPAGTGRKDDAQGDTAGLIKYITLKRNSITHFYKYRHA
jgi:hypothetical protein